MDHLETKKQIVALREKFGEENWLINHAGNVVQNIMGLPPPTTILSLTLSETGIVPAEQKSPEVSGEDISGLVKDEKVVEDVEKKEETEENGIETISEISNVPEPAYDPADGNADDKCKETS